MNFDEIELSTQDGSPVELYQFNYSGKSWYLTNGLSAITYENRTYLPTTISRGEMNNNGDTGKSTCDIDVAYDSDVANLFIVQPPSEVVTLTIFALHLTQSEIRPMVIWKGRVVQVNWKNSICTLNTENVFSSLQRTGVTRKYSRQCTHTLYTPACGVNHLDHSIALIVTAISGNKVSFSGIPNHAHFAGGIMRYNNNQTNAIERRSISSTSENFITLTMNPLSLSIGQTVTLVKGCSHTMESCHHVFNNSANYGGQPYVPALNPFGNSPLW